MSHISLFVFWVFFLLPIWHWAKKVASLTLLCREMQFAQVKRTKTKQQNTTWAFVVLLRSFLWFVPTLLSLINFPHAAAVWRQSCHLLYISRWQAPNVYRVDVRSQLIANEAVAGKRLAEWACVCATIRLHRVPPWKQRGTRSDRGWNKDGNTGVATEKLIRKELAVFFIY